MSEPKKRKTIAEGRKPGQGRKPSGRQKISLDILPTALAKLDAKRGEIPRGKYIEGLLG